MSDWRSTRQVWGVDDLGRKVLVYAVGDPIPEDEARRQGLLGGKARDKAPETKHVEAPKETKAVGEPKETKTPKGPPRASRRRRT